MSKKPDESKKPDGSPENKDEVAGKAGKGEGKDGGK
jgi:hypothetical protein